MANNRPDQRLVYLALRNAFQGEAARWRVSNKIQDIILKERKTNSSVRDLIDAHDIKSVEEVTKQLLKQQAFESTLKAKILFPEVFEVSPAQSAERAASEAEASRSEAHAIKTVSEATQATAIQHKDTPATALVPKQKGEVHPKKDHVGGCPTSASLYPVYIPLQTQHIILGIVQQMLEKSCFDFATRSTPELIQKENWECAESVELNIWARIMANQQDKFPPQDIEILGKPLSELLDSVAQLRHTAVHRVKVGAIRIQAFLEDAQLLAKLLRDDYCTQKLSYFSRQVYMGIEDIKRNKDLLETQYNATMRRIAVQKAELERQAKAALDDMFKEDSQYVQLAGMAINQAIDSPDTVLPSVASTELGNDSDTEIARVDSNSSDVELVGEDWTGDGALTS